MGRGRLSPYICSRLGLDSYNPRKEMLTCNERKQGRTGLSPLPGMSLCVQVSTYVFAFVIGLHCLSLVARWPGGRGVQLKIHFCSETQSGSELVCVFAC